MPVPIGTRENRDEEHKQAIIEFEKTVIEPALTKLIQSRPAEENKNELLFYIYSDGSVKKILIK